MKLSFGNKLFLIGVAVVAVTIISLGLIETCVEYEWEIVPCGHPYDDSLCNMKKKSECTTFWTSIMIESDKTCEIHYDSFNDMMQTDKSGALWKYLPLCVTLHDVINECTGLKSGDYTYDFFKTHYCLKV